MSTKIKVQHYVPQSYLRRFSIQGKQDYLHCFDKFKFKKFRVNSKNICCETYFHDTSEDVDQQIEKNLRYLESLWKPTCDKLVSTQDVTRLTSNDRKLIAYFVATQLVRTKKWRQELQSLPLQLAEGIRQMAEKLPQEKWSGDLKSGMELEQLMLKKLATDEEVIKNLHISTLEDIPEYVDIICNKKKWILFVNRTAIPFWCSDHPITRNNPINDSPYGSLGISCKGVEIHCPLSPNLSLCICDSTMYYSWPSKFEISDVQDIELQNSLQVYWSTRFVFSNQGDFSLAERIIRDDPSLATIDGKRTLVD